MPAPFEKALECSTVPEADLGRYPISCPSGCREVALQPQDLDAAARTSAQGRGKRSTSCENVADMIERVRVLLSFTQTRSSAAEMLEGVGRNPYTTANVPSARDPKPASAATHQAFDTVAAGVDEVVASASNLEDLDMSEFLTSYSPSARSRLLSRGGGIAEATTCSSSPLHKHAALSSNNSQHMLAAAAAAGAPAQELLASADVHSPQSSGNSSPGASDSMPDLDAFWAESGLYSGSATRNNSRYFSADAIAQQRRSTAEATGPTVARNFDVESMLGEAAVETTCPDGAVGPVPATGQSSRSPSPSRKALSLHGPSRLSMETAAKPGYETRQQASFTAQHKGASDQPGSSSGTIAGTTEPAPGAPIHQAQVPAVDEPVPANAAELLACWGDDGQAHDHGQQREQPVVIQPTVASSDQPASGKQQQQQQDESSNRIQSLKRMLFDSLGQGSTKPADWEHYQQGKQRQSPTKQQQPTEAGSPKWGLLKMFARVRSRSGSGVASASNSPSKLETQQLEPVQATQSGFQPEPQADVLTFPELPSHDNSSNSNAVAMVRGTDTRQTRTAGHSSELSKPDDAGAISEAACTLTPDLVATGVVPTVPWVISLNGGVQPVETGSLPQSRLCMQLQPSSNSAAAVATISASLFPDRAAAVSDGAFEQAAAECVSHQSGDTAAAAAADAGNQTQSPAVQNLASSMQRIADCLEEFLTDRSPKASCTPLRCSRTRSFSQSPLARTSMAGEQPAATPIAPASPTPHSAPAEQKHTGEWAPAAAAARARLLSSAAIDAAAAAADKQSQDVLNQADPGHVAGCMSQTLANSSTPTEVLAAPDPPDGSSVGWLHPSGFDEVKGSACLDVQQHDSNRYQQVSATGASESIGANVAEAMAPAEKLLLLASRAVGFDLAVNSLQEAGRTLVSASQPCEKSQHQLLQHSMPAAVHKQQVTAQSQPDPAPTAASHEDIQVVAAAPLTPEYAALSTSSPVGSSRRHCSSPTSLQHPRLWRPANVKVPRTRLKTTQPADRVTMDTSVACDINLQQVLLEQAQATCLHLLTPDYEMQPAAVQVGPAPNLAHVSGVETDFGRQLLPASAVHEGSARCLVATADVKLLQRDQVQEIRLLQPTSFPEASPASLQHMESKVQHLPQHYLHSHATAGQRLDPALLAWPSSMHCMDAAAGLSDHAEAVKLVRFPVRVEANPLQPPMLLYNPMKAAAFGRQHGLNADGPTGLNSLQQQQQPQTSTHNSNLNTQKLWQKAATARQQQRSLHQQQQHHPLAPWEKDNQRSPSDKSPRAGGRTLTAGRRAAELLDILHKQTAQRQDTKVPTAVQRQDVTSTAQQEPVSGFQVAGIQTDPIRKDASTEPMADTAEMLPLQLPSSPVRHHSSQQVQRSPMRRTRRTAGGGSVKWVALQQLKARNRMHRQGPTHKHAGSNHASTAEQQQQTVDDDGSAAAQRLLDQLQQFIPIIRRDADSSSHMLQSSGLVPSEPRLDLDAAVAAALHRPKQPSSTAPHLHHSLQHPTQLPAAANSLDQLDRQQTAASGNHTPDSHQQDQTAVAHAEGVAAVDTPHPPLLLPRMLSRAPLVDAEVQAGVYHAAASLADLLQQQQLLLQQQLLAQQQGSHVPNTAEPVTVVFNVAGDTATDPGARVQQQQSMPPVQQPPPISPAAMVALAAAAGAGAASAVHSSTPTRCHGTAAATAAAPQQQERQQPDSSDGTSELARLIANAFKHAGGIITPDKHALDQGISSSEDRVPVGLHPSGVQQQQLQGVDLLHNPLAGRTAPQFSHVVDYIPPATENSSAMLDHQVWSEQQQQGQREPLLVLPDMSNSLSPHKGCCFAACPERIPSPTFKGSPTAPALHIPGRRSRQQRSNHQVQADSRAGGHTAHRSSVVRSSKRNTHVSRSRSHLRRSDAHGKFETFTGHEQPVHHTCKHQQRRRHAAELREVGGRQQQLQQAAMARSRDGASLTDWASQQTRQLADLWQQWQDQQVRSQRQQQQQDRKHAGNENQDPNPAAGTRLLKQSQASQAAVPPAGSSVHSDSRDSRPAVYTAARYMEPSDQASGAATAVGVPGTAASTQGINTQQHDPKLQQERESLDAAYRRAAAARSAAKAAAKRAAEARSQRFRAELLDLSKLLADVDTLAAQMEAEAAGTAAALSGFL